MFVSLHSWIGVQVGYVHSAFDNAVCRAQCNGSYVADDFILVVETIRKFNRELIISNLYRVVKLL